MPLHLWVSRWREEEEECIERSPLEDDWGFSCLVASLAFYLFACLFAGFPGASAESTMRAVLQLQLTGPVPRMSQGREGSRLLLVKHRLQLPGTRRCPRRAQQGRQCWQGWGDR